MPNLPPIALAAAVSPWVWSWLFYFWMFAYVLGLLSIPSVLLQRQGRPQAALSWVLVLFLLPGLGILLWWAIGRRHLLRRRRKKRKAAARLSERLAELRETLESTPETDWELMPIRRLPEEEAEWVFAPTTGNRVELLVNAKETYAELERLIAGAKRHLHVLYYIWQNDVTGCRFRDLLVEKARAGVEVRVLLDAVGSYYVCGSGMAPLREAGGQVVSFHPPKIFRRSLELNFRNHRKMFLADGRAAVIGGLNIGDEYTRSWRDAAIRVEGPAVDQMQEVFADDWYFATSDDFARADHFGGWRDTRRAEDRAICGIIASGPHTELNFTHEAFFLAINGAERRVFVSTPYFIPDQAIVASLRSAVMRGVDVRILVPGTSDAPLVRLAGRSYYRELLRFGVRIFEYGDGILHAKTTVIDDDVSIVGSANIDIRSFRLNFEMNCFVRDEALNAKLAEVFLGDLGKSREVTLEEMENASYFQRLTEAAAHLFSPLL